MLIDAFFKLFVANVAVMSVNEVPCEFNLIYNIARLLFFENAVMSL